MEACIPKFWKETVRQAGLLLLLVLLVLPPYWSASGRNSERQIIIRQLYPRQVVLIDLACKALTWGSSVSVKSLVLINI